MSFRTSQTVVCFNYKGLLTQPNLFLTSRIFMSIQSEYLTPFLVYSFADKRRNCSQVFHIMNPHVISSLHMLSSLFKTNRGIRSRATWTRKFLLAHLSLLCAGSSFCAALDPDHCVPNSPASSRCPLLNLPLFYLDGCNLCLLSFSRSI
jgi:hypothetical protein